MSNRRVPRELKDEGPRGPHGTEAMGLSVAIQANDAPRDQEGWEAMMREYAPQLLERLRLHVGGTRPRTEPKLTADGPFPDPLQGPIYVITASAWFHPMELPPDCTARRARDGETRN